MSSDDAYSQAGASSFVAGLASIHLAAALLVFGVAAAGLGWSDGGIHGASVFLALGTPAVLALLGLRGRWPLVLAAALCSATLVFVPFSLHSFVLGPLAVLYAVGYLSNAARPRLSGWRTLSALAALPPLAVIVFVGPTLLGDPEPGAAASLIRVAGFATMIALGARCPPPGSGSAGGAG